MADPVQEARRLLDAAAEAVVPLRAIGGVAIRLRAGDDVAAAFVRSYGDIDLACTKGRGGEVSALLVGLGYEADQRFNALHGSRRLMFNDDDNERRIDVFVGAFEMCHTLPITRRLDVNPLTIPAAELLLTKLQVVELTEKDTLDALALILGEPLRTDDDAGLNAGEVARLCAADWGLWRTCKQNLARLDEAVNPLDLSDVDKATLHERIAALWTRIEAEPKPSKWRLRDRIGDRKRWYEQPEEAH